MAVVGSPILFVLCFSSPAAEPLSLGEMRRIESEIMGETRPYFVALPKTYDTGLEFPVLYLTDGDAHFRHTAGTVSFLARNNRMPDMIVVALANTNRRRDLSPPGGDAGTGGADRLLDFFEKELIPTVDATYRTRPFRVFAGHSLGGLFAVHAFTARPELFNGVIAVSPSLWWAGGAPVDSLGEMLAKRERLDRVLFVTLGNERDAMRSNYERFVSLLEKTEVPGFVWGSSLIEEEDHGSVVLKSHYQGLEKIFEGWSPSPGLFEAGLDALKRHYTDLSKRYGFDVGIPERTVNSLGYYLLGRDDLKGALAAFRYNIERYPNSANVYDSYGAALERNNELEKARANYRRAFELAEKRPHPYTAVYRANLDRVAGMLEAEK